MALYALVDAAPHVLAAAALLMQGLLRQDAAPVQVAAARGLSDMCMAFSAGRVDGVLCASTAGSGDAAGQAEAGGGGGGHTAGAGVAELLVRNVRALLGGSVGGKAKGENRCVCVGGGLWRARRAAAAELPGGAWW